MKIKLPQQQVDPRRPAPINLQNSITSNLIGESAQGRRQLLLGRSLADAADFLVLRQNQQDITAIQNAETAWKDLELAKQRDLLNRKGTDAQNITDEADRFFEFNGEGELIGEDGFLDTLDVHSPEVGQHIPIHKNRADLSEQFNNYLDQYNKLSPRARDVFDSSRNGRRANFIKTIGAHEDRERLAGMQNSYKINREKTVEVALANPYEPETINKELRTLKNAATGLGDALGWDEETLKREIELNTSTVHTGVVEARLSAKDPKGAREYFQQHKKEILPKTRLKLEESINTSRILGEAQVLADEISDMDPTKRVDKIRAIKDPDVRAKVEDQLAQNDAVADKARALQNKTDLAAVDKVVYPADGSPAPKLTDLEGMEEFQRLNVEQKRAYRNILKNNRKIVIDDQKQAEISEMFNRMIVSQDPEVRAGFMDLNIPVDFQGKLDFAHMEKFMEIQKKMIAGEGKPHKSTLTANEVGGTKFKAIGWIGDKFARHRNIVQDLVNEEILLLEEKQKAPASTEQVNEIFRKALSPTNISTLNKRFGDPDVRKAATGVFTVQQRLSAFFKKNDLNVTEDRERIGAIETEVQNRLTGIQNLTGQKVPDHQVDEIINTVGSDFVQVEGILFDSKKLLSELTDDEIKDAYVDASGKEVRLTEILGLSLEKRDKIARELRSKGLLPTVQNVAEFLVAEENSVARQPARKPRTLTSADGKHERNLAEFVADLRQRPLDALKSQRAFLVKFWGPEGEKIIDQVISEKEAVDK